MPRTTAERSVIAAFCFALSKVLIRRGDPGVKSMPMCRCALGDASCSSHLQLQIFNEHAAQPRSGAYRQHRPSLDTQGE